MKRFFISVCAIFAIFMTATLCAVTAAAMDKTLCVLETVSLSNPTDDTAEHTYIIDLPDSGYIKLFAGNAATDRSTEITVCGKSGTLGELLHKPVQAGKGRHTLTVRLAAKSSVRRLCYAFVSDSGKSASTSSIVLTGTRCGLSSFSDSARWTSSDSSIASVDSKGRVTVKRAGEVVIRGYGKAGSLRTAKLYCVSPVTGDFSPSTVLICTDESFTKARLEKLLKTFDMTVIYDYDSFNMYALGLSRELDASEMAVLLKKLSLKKGVVSAEPDYIISLDDPVLSEQPELLQ